MCEICPELTINTTERCQLGCSNVFVLNFGHIIQWRTRTFIEQERFCKKGNDVCGYFSQLECSFDLIYRPRLAFSYDVNTIVLAFNALFGEYIFRHEKEVSAQWYYDL